MAADQAGDGILVGEDANDVGTALDLAVEAFQRIGGVDFGSVIFGEAHKGEDIGFGLIHQRCQFGNLRSELIGNLGHCRRAISASSWAKAVAMKAATTRRPCLPAWARTLRMKCTRQRCQEACRTLATAALSPSCASEITSLTPLRPRLASERRNSVQNVSASEAPIAMPSTSPRPSLLTATATITATETMRPVARTLG